MNETQASGVIMASRLRAAASDISAHPITGASAVERQQSRGYVVDQPEVAGPARSCQYAPVASATSAPSCMSR